MQAINAYKAQAPDSSLMKPGETPAQMATRMYAFAISRLLMAVAITDGFVYKADSLVRSDMPEADKLRQGMMRHYWRFTDRLATLTDAPQDFIDDLREKALKRMHRKMQALVNAIDKEFVRLGIGHHECCAVLCAYGNFITVAREAYQASVRPLGQVLIKSLPKYPMQALDVLDMSGEYANKIITLADPGHLGEGHKPNAAMTRLAESLLEKMASNEEFSRAANYALKGMKDSQNTKENK